MVDPLTLVAIGIILALLFDFGNGFNDAANSISTAIATNVLTLPQAVVLAAAANFVAAFVFGVAVATTIGKGIIDPAIVSPTLIISTLIGAIFWIYLTTFLGLPISASHSVIGGLLGAGISAIGIASIQWSGIITIIIFIAIAPLFGLLAAIVFSIITLWIFKNTDHLKTNNYFKRLQLISISVYSLGHGTNDAQKTMGIISLLLFSAGLLGKEFFVPFWVVLISHGTIALGTLAGGWRVIKTLGMKLTNLKPIQGFCAESAGATTIILCSIFGIPISTTHVIAGSITGVGLAKRTSAVRWTTARKIMLAWIITIPATAITSFIAYKALAMIV